ncbi:HEAT repeat domain-containing protein [Halobaculum sp. WSA2]|uniref:HEAT repeat domain-containing protein n=1 Tax=Halobaculum saliterrae TaxID=2073113 RepID=A0A6B0SU21_9EURY|nr:HEAT repeat domain-containing protein [Halobaculum saliterrae]MXR40191.1 HEAT repeat domain-containing protein [Halobaculum saliterrae]
MDPVRSFLRSSLRARHRHATSGPLQTGSLGGIDERLVLWVGVVIGSLLVAVFVLTVAVSGYEAWLRRRREAVRDDVRSGLLDRLYDPDEPGWEAWVEGMNGPERHVATDLLDEYLRTLEGADADRLRGLGDALGIGERSRGRLDARDEYARLRALGWLTLLRDVPESVAAGEHDPATPRERAAVARLLYETDPEAYADRAVDVLLADAREPFPAFGTDTLYRLATTDPTAVVERAAADYGRWSPDLLAQVLVVCRAVETGLAGADLSWIVALLEHEAEAVRVEAALTLARFGWRTPIREEAFLRRATDDDSPRARGAGYAMLGAWGDERSVAVLGAALREEPNDRALLAGAEALTDAGVPREEVPERARPAWEWVREQRRYDDRARNVDPGDGEVAVSSDGHGTPDREESERAEIDAFEPGPTEGPPEGGT